VCHRCERGDDFAVSGFVTDLEEEVAVELQDVDPDVLEVSERGVSGSEVVKRDPDTEGRQRRDRVIGADQRVLGDFQAQPSSRDPVAFQDRRDVFTETRIPESDAGDVDRQRELLVAAAGARLGRELPACLLEHEGVDLCGQPEPVGGWDEFRGEHHSVFGVSSTNERLDTAEGSVFETEEGLIEHEQL
jgi:hypothetical protein